MAKSHKVKKGSKARAKTSLPPVKESYMKNGTKNQRAVSISPTFQSKTLRKLAPRKKTKIKPKEKYVAPLPKSISASQACNTSSYSAAFVDSFSKLSVTDRKPLNNSQRYSKRSFSTDGNGTGKSRFSSLEDVTRLISAGRAKNIVVMAGAGISTASGIPDFRTPGTGLYDNLQSYRIPSPTAIFDLDYFFHDPKPFFALAKELYPSGKYQPCHPHHFVRLLHEKGILLRMYTQNIDGLERIAGIPPEKLVEAHGTFATASCVRCNKKYDGEEIKQRILSGVLPRCKSTALCGGIIKPDIVFFGEDLPRRFYYYLKDFPVCDLLIIMGTSLEVEPFASLTNSVRSSTPRLLMNMELVGPFAKSGLKRPYDISVTGDLTHSVKKFTHLLGWKVDLKSLMMVNKNLEGGENDQENSESNSSDSGHISSPSNTVSPYESLGSNKKELKPLRKPNSDIKRYYSSLPLAKSSVHSQSPYTGYCNSSSYFSYIKGRNSGLTPNATTYSVVKTGKPPRSISYGRVKADSSITIHYAQTVGQKPGAKLNFNAISSAKNCVRNLSSNSDSSGESHSESTDSDSNDNTSSDDSYT